MTAIVHGTSCPVFDDLAIAGGDQVVLIDIRGFRKIVSASAFERCRPWTWGSLIDLEGDEEEIVAVRKTPEEIRQRLAGFRSGSRTAALA